MIGLCEFCAYKQSDCKGNKDLEKLKCEYYKKRPVQNVKQMAERIAELEAEVERLRNVHNLHSGDSISRADAIEAVEKLKIVEDNNIFPDYAYNAGIETAKKTLELMLSADAEEYIKERNTKTHDLVHRDAIKPKLVDCTDFIEWLVDRVLDETIWEYNSVAYGEIICRKLEKLGVLETTEEPSYYIRPSADAKWIPCSERLPEKSGWYLVTIRGYETVTDVSLYSADGSAWGDVSTKQTVLAWMPLPEPYREDGEA